MGFELPQRFIMKDEETLEEEKTCVMKRLEFVVAITAWVCSNCDKTIYHLGKFCPECRERVIGEK